MYVGQYFYDCITTHIIVSILKYKYSYICMYSNFKKTYKITKMIEIHLTYVYKLINYL